MGSQRTIGIVVHGDEIKLIILQDGMRVHHILATDMSESIDLTCKQMPLDFAEDVREPDDLDGNDLSSTPDQPYHRSRTYLCRRCLLHPSLKLPPSHKHIRQSVQYSYFQTSPTIIFISHKPPAIPIPPIFYLSS